MKSNTLARALDELAARAAATAKLDMIASNMPGACLQIIVASTILIFIVDERISHIGGPFTGWHIAWLGGQFMLAAAFLTVSRIWPKGSGAESGTACRRRRHTYVALYFASGAMWGSYVWVAMVPGDLYNQVFVMMVVVSLSLVYAVRLAAAPHVLMSAYAGLFLVAVPKTMVAEDALSSVVFYLAPFWLTFMLHAAGQLSRQIGEMMDMRLREHDLAASLADAHARVEAESAAKSAFLANMSHELRTPLNAIIGFSDVMRTGLFGELQGRYRGYVEDIHASGAHLLSLINDLLDLSKIEAGQVQLSIEPVATADMAMQVTRMLEARAEEKHQTLTLDLQDAPLIIAADARALKQILFNIAGNAVKYTQRGGTIAIRIAAEGGDVILSVCDDGPGIPVDKQQRLFRPFERVDNSYLAGEAGTGLGLALVRKLAHLHGGDAVLESAMGAGTTVTVRLPGAAVNKPGAAGNKPGAVASGRAQAA